ncbi:MAG: hypothetical protein JWM57_2684 [Phycisphaerales bacterium]|nr:hypothetical protein [Phycisphaerales bacterium]
MKAALASDQKNARARWNAIERGRTTNLSLASLDRIAAALGVRPGDLMADVKVKPMEKTKTPTLAMVRKMILDDPAAIAHDPAVLAAIIGALAKSGKPAK